MLLSVVHNFSTAREALEFAKQLRATGHQAVQLDSTYTHDHKFLSARVTHFLTCNRCAEIQAEVQRGKMEQAGSAEIPAGTGVAAEGGQRENVIHRDGHGGDGKEFQPSPGSEEGLRGSSEESQRVELEALCAGSTVENLESSSTQKLTLNSGATVYLSSEPYASIEDKEKLMAWVKKHRLTTMLMIHFKTRKPRQGRGLVNGQPAAARRKGVHQDKRKTTKRK